MKRTYGKHFKKLKEKDKNITIHHLKKIKLSGMRKIEMIISGTDVVVEIFTTRPMNQENFNN